MPHTETPLVFKSQLQPDKYIVCDGWTKFYASEEEVRRIEYNPRHVPMLPNTVQINARSVFYYEHSFNRDVERIYFLAESFPMQGNVWQ